MSRRRSIIGLSILGGLIGQVVTLYQIRIIPHLPDPLVPIFNADKVIDLYSKLQIYLTEPHYFR